MNKTLGVIPARLASSRFPNKPLKKILGIPMIAHCYLRAKYCKNIDHIVLATPDEEIFEFGKKLKFEVCMTSSVHERATERAGEVVQIYKNKNKYFDNVILIQGDEPQLDPVVIDNLADKIKTSKNGVVNLIHQIQKKDFEDENVVKLVFNNRKEVLNFSRTLLPRNPRHAYRQLGLIAFRTEILEKFISLNSSKYEKIESIDMMRLIENDYMIDTLETDKPIIGVDEEHHIKLVEECLHSDKYFLDYRNKYL